MVVVTGLGLITASGNDVKSTWENLCTGNSAVSEIPYWNFDSYKAKLAGVIKGFKPDDFFSKKQLKRLDYCHQIGLAAARMAVEDAQFSYDAVDKTKIGLFLGTSLGGTLSGQIYHEQSLSGKTKSASLATNYPMQVLLDKLTEEFNFLGPRTIVSTACTASTIAIAQAVEAIRSGQIDCALVGGVDPLCQFSFAGFSSMQNMSAEPCAPFSAPIGLNLGEGAGMMILESAAHAAKRNVRIYAEIGGFALGADAYHATSPDISAMGQKNLLINVLKDSNELAENIDYINAHGTATTGNDLIESKGIKLALGHFVKNVQVSSSKGAFGHTLGAAGAVEAVVTILSVYNDLIPPTANFKEVRPGCDLTHVKSEAMKKVVNKAITQNFAFGGNNAALLIRKVGSGIRAERPINERCVITGFDLISPTGIGKEAFLAALKNKTSVVQNDYGILIDNFAPQKLSRADFRRSDRVGSLTVCVSEMAFKNAVLSSSKDVSEKTGLIFGSEGPIETTRLFNEPIALGNGVGVNPSLFPNTVLNAGTGLASIHLKLKGPNIALNVGESSGLRALSQGYDLIKSRISERLICGGVDEQNELRLDAVALVKKKIFNKTKNDLRGKRNVVLGEGAVAFVLESYDVALARNANILAEVVGYSNSANSVSGDRAEEFTRGMYRSMSEAIQAARLEPKDIDFICSAALSGAGDPFENEAIEQLFKRNVPKYTPSKYFGLSAATAPIGMSAILLALSGELSFELLVDAPEMTKLLSKDVKVCLINSMSMGNNNISLIIKKC